MTALIILGVLVVLVLRAILVPYVMCVWCRGTGRNPFSGSRRHGDCWFCKGKRRRRVLTAMLARRLWLTYRARKPKGR